jgi:hypothetical protein
MVKLKNQPVMSGVKQVVRDDVGNSLLVIDGRSYDFDVDARGNTLLVELDMTKYNARIDKLVSKLRSSLDADAVLRNCLTGQPLRKLRLIDRALRSGVKPVMRLLSGGEVVAIEIGKLQVAITDGTSPAMAGIADFVKLRRLIPAHTKLVTWYVVAGHQQKVFNYADYNLLFVNDICYAFDVVDIDTPSLIEVDCADYRKMIDRLVNKLRRAFSAEIVLRRCLTKIMVTDLHWVERKCRSNSLKLGMYQTRDDIFMVLGKRHPCLLGVGIRSSEC